MPEELPDRTRRKVIGEMRMARGERAREVVAEYGDGTVRREIEVGEDGRYVPRFVEVDDCE